MYISMGVALRFTQTAADYTHVCLLRDDGQYADSSNNNINIYFLIR